MEWTEYIDEADWHQTSKDQYQLALIAQQIFRIAAMLSSSKSKIPTLEEFLVKFKRRQDDTVKRDAKTGQQKKIKIGSPLDSEWKKITEDSKNSWMAALGAFGAVYTPPPGKKK